MLSVRPLIMNNTRVKDLKKGSLLHFNEVLEILTFSRFLYIYIYIYYFFKRNNDDCCLHLQLSPFVAGIYNPKIGIGCIVSLELHQTSILSLHFICKKLV